MHKAVITIIKLIVCSKIVDFPQNPYFSIYLETFSLHEHNTADSCLHLLISNYFFFPQIVNI